MYGIKVDLTTYIDSQYLYGLYTLLALTTQRRLLIDTNLFKKAHERRETGDAIWVIKKASPIDEFLTIADALDLSSIVIATNKFCLNLEA